MSGNAQTFEKLSFRQLLENRKVEIPIIQRDYAQGRAKKEKVRNDFLDALKDALSGGASVELDFVYGSEKDNVLQPLDGQQRLTTLFLLYWFVANKEGKLGEAKERLSKFTYETRTSSREFCNELVNESVKYNPETQISAVIKNAVWFVESWQKDPTISAMLIMLDAIQEKFKDASDIWGKPAETAADKRPITFLYIELKNFGLSDDLYIKMNARGKQLTSFENFKARFEKHIEKNKWEEGINNPQAAFAHKIDTVWTDLFWKYRGDDNLVDNKMVNFIAGITINYYAQGPTSKDDIENKITNLSNNPNDINAEDFSKEAFGYLENCLNKYAEKSDDNYLNAELKTDTPLWDYCENTLFRDVIDGEKITQKKRVLFFAQTEYLLKYNSFDRTAFNDWMRVIRNIVENAQAGNWNNEYMVSMMNLVKKWVDSDYPSNIHTALSKLTHSGIASEQVKEEIEKAKIIVSNPNAKQVLHDMEDTNFCKGKIDFALYCIDYDIAKKPQPENFKKDDLRKILDVINLHFVNMNDNKLSDDFKRAFLTVEKNDYYEVWKTWSYSFDCHKRWLLETKDDLRKSFSQTKDWKRDYLKELFSQLVVKHSFKQIIEDYVVPPKMPNWKQRLIKENGLLEGATFILIPNDDSYCYLAWQQRPGRDDQVKEIK